MQCGRVGSRLLLFIKKPRLQYCSRGFLFYSSFIRRFF
nr:MAG TPA: hypothetical protein [Caudoviricetes sp.]